jgi:hypothetical protein
MTAGNRVAVAELATRRTIAGQRWWDRRVALARLVAEGDVEAARLAVQGANQDAADEAAWGPVDGRLAVRPIGDNDPSACQRCYRMLRATNGDHLQAAANLRALGDDSAADIAIAGEVQNASRAANCTS